MGTLLQQRIELDVTANPPSRWIVVVLGLGGALAGASLVWLAYAADGVQQPALRAVLACWVTIPYIVAGLIAWRRRPESKLGLLMVVAGFASYLSFLNWSGPDVLFTIGVAAQFLPPVLFLHMFLAFPSGRLSSRPARGLVVADYAAMALTLPALLLGSEAPRNVLAVVQEPAAVAVLQSVQLVAVSALSVAGGALIIFRRLRAGRPLRGWLELLLESFSLALVMIAILLLAGLFDWPVAEPIRLVTFAAVGIAPVVFLAGVLQARLGRSSVADLLVDLGVKPGPAELQAAVARALSDPSATIAYWVPEFESYADVDGRSADVVPPAGRSATPITRDHVPVAMLLHDAALDDEPELVASVGAAIGIAIQNARLQVELRAQLEALRESRIRILEAEQNERRRLERDLHDGTQVRLLALALELRRLEDEIGDDPGVRKRLESARKELAVSLAELRGLAQGIHPAVVSDHGLSVALESLTTRATVPVHLDVAITQRLPQAVEIAAYFLVCECLANIAKHAHASEAAVSASCAEGSLVLEIRDDGGGGVSTEVGTGLRGLADRVEALGGRLQVWSPSGEGTRVRAEIPCG